MTCARATSSESVNRVKFKCHALKNTDMKQEKVARATRAVGSSGSARSGTMFKSYGVVRRSEERLSAKSCLVSFFVGFRNSDFAHC